MKHLIYCSLLIGCCLGVCGCGEKIGELTCDEVRDSTSGPIAYRAIDMFGCPDVAADFKNAKMAMVPYYYHEQFFDTLFAIAYAYVDEAKIEDCSTGALSQMSCADYTTDDGIVVFFNDSSSNNDTCQFQRRLVHVELPDGMESWRALNVSVELSSCGNVEYQSDSFSTYEASWTGTPVSGWPVDYMVSYSDHVSEALQYQQMSHNWAQGKEPSPRSDCKIDIERNSERDFDSFTWQQTGLDFMVNDMQRYSAINEMDCTAPDISVIRVIHTDHGDKCVGLFREDSLEYLGPC